MTVGTLVATILALGWIAACARFRRTQRWAGRTRILSGYAVHDIGPAQLRDRFQGSGAAVGDMAVSSSARSKSGELERAAPETSSAAVSPDAAVLITASAHGPALPLPCATAADEISRSAA